MHSLTPSSELRIADLPPDLREEGVRLKDRYHALADEAGFLTEGGAMDLARLGDLERVKTVDLDTLRELAKSAEALRYLKMYTTLPEELRADCTYDIYSSPEFVAEAALHGFTPFQWAGVGYLVFYGSDVIPGMFRPVGEKGLLVTGDLKLRNCVNLTTLPTGLMVRGELNLEGCVALSSIPVRLLVGQGLLFYNCRSLTSLPEGISAGYLSLSRCPVFTTLPADLRLRGYLSIVDCPSMVTLPSGLSIPGSLGVVKCVSFTTFPPDLSVASNVELEGCTALVSLPPNMRFPDDLSLMGCTSLVSLPRGMHVVGSLNLIGCTWLSDIPSDFTVDGDVYCGQCNSVGVGQLQLLKEAGRIKGQLII